VKTINRSQVKGRLGPKIVFQPLPSGDFALRISIATDHVFKRNGVQEKHTEWHQVKTYVPKEKETVFRRHLYKGAWVLVEGPVITEVADKDGGKEFYRFLRPFADDIDFLSPPKEVTNEEPMSVDADAYAPVASRSEVIPLAETVHEPAEAPTPPAPSVPTPRAFEPSQRGRLWDDDDSGTRTSRHHRTRGSVKDLLDQDS
jgi:single-stranded DNA-binding protein